MRPDLRSLQQFLERRVGLRAERSGAGRSVVWLVLSKPGCVVDENDRQIEMRVGVIRIVRDEPEVFPFLLLAVGLSGWR